MTNQGETYKSAADEDLISERVNHSAELAGDAELSGNGTIDKVSQTCDYEQDKSDVEKEPSALLLDSRRPKNHQEKNNGQDEPAAGQYVWDLV
jgi:hypothetical protein